MDRDPSCYEHHEVAVGPDCKHTQSNHAQLKLRALSADEHTAKSRTTGLKLPLSLLVAADICGKLGEEPRLACGIFPDKSDDSVWQKPVFTKRKLHTMRSDSLAELCGVGERNPPSLPDREVA